MKLWFLTVICLVLCPSKASSCPAEFATAEMLYCNGSCGDDWLDNVHGCQQADADAYCKLKECDDSAVAITYEQTVAFSAPGFACDNYGQDFGDWFGMQGVHFHQNVVSNHGQGSVVTNVVCSGDSQQCPAEFATAEMLYCNGSCGDDWLDNVHGCQQADADAYCKLKHCDDSSVATTYEQAVAFSAPGFACDNYGEDFGDWFGMQGVHFHQSVVSNHGQGSVVTNVVCTGDHQQCPAEFATAEMLYCNGTCGDDWLDNVNGCQQADADAYCKLKQCDDSSVAITYEQTVAFSAPGFACDNYGEDFGDWFGMQGVHFHQNVVSNHGQGSVVANVVCS